jgi:chromosome segregation ATPase
VDQDVAATFRDLEKAREEQRKANEEMTELTVAVDTGALEETLAMVPPVRDLEAEHSRLSNQVTAITAELEGSISALPDWNGTLEELATARVPLLETIAEFQNSFLQQSADEKRLFADRARLQVERDQCERDLRRIKQEQAVPTEQDLTSSRTSRDLEWQRIRTAWLEAIAVDRPGLALSFETSMLTSDQIADRLRREAARVSENAALLVSMERLE